MCCPEGFMPNAVYICGDCEEPLEPEESEYLYRAIQTVFDKCMLDVQSILCNTPLTVVETFMFATIK